MALSSHALASLAITRSGELAQGSGSRDISDRGDDLGESREQGEGHRLGRADCVGWSTWTLRCSCGHFMHALSRRALPTVCDRDEPEDIAVMRSAPVGHNL